MFNDNFFLRIYSRKVDRTVPPSKFLEIGTEIRNARFWESDGNSGCCFFEYFTETICSLFHVEQLRQWSAMVKTWE